MNLARHLLQAATKTPDKIAIYDGTTAYASYAAWLHQAQALAAGLQQKGIQSGDKIAVYSANTPEYLIVFYAIWWLGATVVPINYKLHPNEMAWIVEHAQAKLLFSHTDCATPPHCECITFSSPAYQALFVLDCTIAQPAALADTAIAWIFYTSGTTGRPKGAMLSHHNLQAMIDSYIAKVDTPTSEDHQLYAAPISHGAGLYHLIGVCYGCAHVVPQSRAVVESEIQQLAAHFQQLVWFAAPTMIKRLIDHAQRTHWHGEGIKTIIYGGGPMYLADINQALQQFGNRFVQIYGQGETPMTISVLTRAQLADTTQHNWQQRRVSVGQVAANTRVKIVDAQLAELPAHTQGEIIVQGNTVMQGYYQNTAANAKAFHNGWLRTGDLGYLDEDGFLYLTDRMNDVIISGGANIYPREVEEVLLRHPAIDAVSVVGQKDAEWGEIVVAFVVTHNQQTPDTATLDDWCKQHIASFKKPKAYHFLDNLPKNSYGKVLKTALRAKLA